MSTSNSGVVTLFELMPSLKAITVNRSFDTRSRGPSVCARGNDIEVGGHSILGEYSRRKDAFYVDANGIPTCQELCPLDLVLPMLAARLVAVRWDSPNHLECAVEACLPIAAAVTDTAFPGASLAGARLIDITLIDQGQRRRTIHAEAPPSLRSGAPILVALKSVELQSNTPNSSAAAEDWAASEPEGPQIRSAITLRR
jgi:hypothetical protein